MPGPIEITTEAAGAVAEGLLALGSAESHTLRALSIENLAALSAEASYRLMAREKERPIGLLLADSGEEGVTLRALVVHPEWRRRGVGRSLVDRLSAEVSVAEPRTLATATVDSRDEAANAFFGALGWIGEETGGRQMRRDLDDLPPVRVAAGYRLRTYQEGDGAAWMRVIGSAFATEAGSHAPRDASAFQREYLENPLFEPRRVFFAVREADGEVAGTTSSWESEIDGRRVGLIHWVAVDPAHRGHGLGEALNLAALHDMRARGHREAYLNTSANLRHAVRLYELLGFRVARRRVVYRSQAPDR